MTKSAQHKDGKSWSKPPSADTKPEAGYDEWLVAEIDAGCAELDGGKAIPAAKVWKKLGLE